LLRQQQIHHKRCVCVGTKLPPPNRASALLALLGPDTDHAVVIAAAAMIAMVMILRISSSTSGLIKTWRED